MIEGLNRAFLYGESVFTTLRMVDGELRDWNLHFERLKKGVEYVFGPFVDGEDWVVLLKNRLEAASQNETGDKIIRYTIYRHQTRGLEKTGLISASDLKLHFLASPYVPSRTEGRSLRLRSCTAMTRPDWWPDYLKAGSYLDVILAQRLYLKDKDDDLLFLSRQDTVLESSVANIFIVRQNKLYTAPTGPNVLDGIMRKKVVGAALDFFDECLEVPTGLDEAIQAEAVFGSNSVRGLFLIDAIDDQEMTYTKDFLAKFELMRSRVMK